MLLNISRTLKLNPAPAQVLKYLRGFVIKLIKSNKKSTYVKKKKIVGKDKLHGYKREFG